MIYVWSARKSCLGGTSENRANIPILSLSHTLAYHPVGLFLFSFPNSSSGVRGISIAAGQHHTNRRGGHHHHKTTTTTTAAASSNVATIAPPPGTTVTVRVGLNMNMCRLCLAEGTASTRLQPVFYTKDTPDEALLQRIAELTTIQVGSGVELKCLRQS